MMTVSPGALNLASQPFRRERAQNAIYAFVCLALTCSLLVLIGLIFQERARASSLRREIDQERSQLLRLQREQGQFSSVLGRPENADVFAKSVFLNQLIARRAVSWTLVFKDLETVMPPNMRLVALRLPQIPSEDIGGVDHVQLDMVVGTDRPDAMIQLLKSLQGSPLFGAAGVVNQQPPTQNDPLYRYRVTVAYAQKL
jgi:type IV pilus assembly protein PilN